MRAKEFLSESALFESRGVTARDPGQTYISDTNPGDILTIQSVDLIVPEGALQFETTEEMLSAVDQAIPPGAVQIDDNKPALGTGPGSSKAAIIATVTNTSKQTQCWVRYVKAIPPTGPHTLWQTLRGYKFSQGSKEESIPIKPADIILDDRPRSATQLAKEIKVGVANQVNGTQYQALAPIMTQAVDLALRGQKANIKGGAEYSRVVGKYGGEYLGPIAVVQGWGSTKGDIAKMMQAFKINSLAGTTIRFPQNKEEELIDSIFTLPNGTQLNVSTKIHKGNGAASSLSGVAAQLTDEINEKFPTGSLIIDALGTMSAVDGPLYVAQTLGILNVNDIKDFDMISKSERNIRAITNPKLLKIVQGQGYLKDAEKNPAYRVFYHALTAIVNQVIKKVNAMPEFHSAMLAALNNNNYLQLVTDVRNVGQDITIDYYGKFPAVYQGRPEIRNKAYFVTGQKGRLGFKLV